jgi:hypothetical protein
VLVEYLIPPKHTAIAQGEHVFFDIDVKGGEKEWSRPDDTVRGPNRLAQQFRVAINAKGGYCWHVYRKSMLLIDGKNNNNDSMLIGRVCLSLMARSECASMEKHEQSKLKRISADSHVVHRCAPRPRLTCCQRSREIM